MRAEPIAKEGIVSKQTLAFDTRGSQVELLFTFGGATWDGLSFALGRDKRTKGKGKSVL